MVILVVELFAQLVAGAWRLADDVLTAVNGERRDPDMREREMVGPVVVARGRVRVG